MITLDNITIRQGAFVLENIGFTIPGGAYCCLVGKTGSGKTTLMEAICGLRRIEAGTISILGKDVTRAKPAVRSIGFVPQDAALFSTMTVEEHIAFPLRIRRWSHREIENRVQELSQFLGIDHLRHRKPEGLSGGECQRVALGRALSFSPRVLCLDEPLSALDSDTKGRMIELLCRVKLEQAVTILHITHSDDEVEELATLVLSLGPDPAGKIVCQESRPCRIQSDSRAPARRGAAGMLNA